MFGVFESKRSTQRIDLASVRDTLLYIESDFEHAPELQRVTDAIRAALAEIDRIELSDRKLQAPEITGAQFLPAQI